MKEVIDGWLRADLDALRKRRHSVRRIHARLTGEHRAEGVSYPAVRDYVSRRREEIRVEEGRGPAKVFVPQHHPPGQLAERGHEVIAGVRRAGVAPAHPRIRPVTLNITDAAQLAAAAKDAGQLSGLVKSRRTHLHRPRGAPAPRALARAARGERCRAGGGDSGVLARDQGWTRAGRHDRPCRWPHRHAFYLDAYSASKFAVEAISDALRQDLARWKVPVIIIEPGSSSHGTGPAPKRPLSARG